MIQRTTRKNPRDYILNTLERDFREIDNYILKVISASIGGSQYIKEISKSNTYIKVIRESKEFRGPLIGSFRENVKLKSWIRRIAINETYDAIQKQKEFLPLEELMEVEDKRIIDVKRNGNPYLDKIIGAEEERELYRAIELLLEKQKSIVKRRLRGQPHKEIARELNIKQGASKSRLNRAVKSLREIMLN